MIRKLFYFVKELIWLCCVLTVILVIAYLGSKYILKDTTAFDNLAIILQDVRKYVIGDFKYASVELKDENFNTEVEKAKNYYYLQLDDNAKKIYIVLENNIEAIKNSENNINLPTELADILKQTNGQQILQQAFQDAWDAFSKDKPEYFYLDGNKFCLVTKTINTIKSVNYEVSISKGGNATYFIEGYNSKEEVEQAISKVNQDWEDIKNSIITNELSDYDKILRVHNWIVDNIEYDEQLATKNYANIYGAIINKKVICEGYSEVFKYMMDDLGVPCIIVCGIGRNATTQVMENHAWNYVYINGSWYAVDTTWDDPIFYSNGNKINTDKYKYRYFLKGSETIKQDHTANGRIIENGKLFIYPELSEKDYK